MLLTEKVAVIFAANGAISSAVARAMAQQGAILYLTGRDQGRLDQLASELAKHSPAVHTQVVDATDEQAIDACFQKIAEAEGRIDIIFNGIGLRPSENEYGTPTAMLSFEGFMAPFQVHVGSQFLTARVGARYMQQTNSAGTILTLTSSLSRMKVPFMTGFVAACTAIEGLTRSLATEYGRSGIKVTCLNPTAIYGTRTIEETTAANAKLMGISVEEWSAQLGQQYLLGTGPTLEQVGQVAAFLASEHGIPFNSHIVDIDCGSMMVI